ncbi:unnamed protein product [Amoebophrya sp. A120]|nr:unnamed protein product [Amoebophrya sp. A120]|eukprot:GSA120T00023908001.1
MMSKTLFFRRVVVLIYTASALPGALARGGWASNISGGVVDSCSQPVVARPCHVDDLRRTVELGGVALPAGCRAEGTSQPAEEPDVGGQGQQAGEDHIKSANIRIPTRTPSHGRGLQVGAQHEERRKKHDSYGLLEADAPPLLVHLQPPGTCNYSLAEQDEQAKLRCGLSRDEGTLSSCACARPRGHGQDDSEEQDQQHECNMLVPASSTTTRAGYNFLDMLHNPPVVPPAAAAPHGKSYPSSSTSVPPRQGQSGPQGERRELREVDVDHGRRRSSCAASLHSDPGPRTSRSTSAWSCEISEPPVADGSILPARQEEPRPSDSSSSRKITPTVDEEIQVEASTTTTSTIPVRNSLTGETILDFPKQKLPAPPVFPSQHLGAAVLASSSTCSAAVEASASPSPPAGNKFIGSCSSLNFLLRTEFYTDEREKQGATRRVGEISNRQCSSTAQTSTVQDLINSVRDLKSIAASSGKEVKISATYESGGPAAPPQKSPPLGRPSFLDPREKVDFTGKTNYFATILPQTLLASHFQELANDALVEDADCFWKKFFGDDDDDIATGKNVVADEDLRTKTKPAPGRSSSQGPQLDAGLGGPAPAFVSPAEVEFHRQHVLSALLDEGANADVDEAQLLPRGRHAITTGQLLQRFIQTQNLIPDEDERAAVKTALETDTGVFHKTAQLQDVCNIKSDGSPWSHLQDTTGATLEIFAKDASSAKIKPSADDEIFQSAIWSETLRQGGDRYKDLLYYNSGGENKMKRKYQRDAEDSPLIPPTFLNQLAKLLQQEIFDAPAVPEFSVPILHQILGGDDDEGLLNYVGFEDSTTRPANAGAGPAADAGGSFIRSRPPTVKWRVKEMEIHSNTGLNDMEMGENGKISARTNRYRTDPPITVEDFDYEFRRRLFDKQMWDFALNDNSLDTRVIRIFGPYSEDVETQLRGPRVRSDKVYVSVAYTTKFDVERLRDHPEYDYSHHFNFKSDLRPPVSHRWSGQTLIFTYRFDFKHHRGRSEAIARRQQIPEWVRGAEQVQADDAESERERKNQAFYQNKLLPRISGFQLDAFPSRYDFYSVDRLTGKSEIQSGKMQRLRLWLENGPEDQDASPGFD